MWERASKERSWQPPVGDSSENSGKRMEKIIDDLLPTKYSEIILVTHGGIIGDYLKNIFPAQVLKQFTDVDFTYDDAIPECSITTIVYNMDKNKIELKELASIKHLLVGDKISL
jgi:broad specificity phosphatase PhoE